jgi:dynein heavy chain
LFALCFFHANILERRKFGPLGWNISYDFTEPDLAVCKTQLHDFLDIYDVIPYTVLHFLFYDINYGGRVTDTIDRRTIMTILNDYVNDRVVSEENYKFSPSGRYTSIEANGVQDYIDYIESLPDIPDPEVFGMHSNAEITSATAQMMAQFELVVRILPRERTAAGSETKEETVERRAKDLLSRTPAGWEIEAVMKKYPTAYSESMNTVLTQETVRYNRLLDVIRKTLKNLLLALKGELVMSQELENMAMALYTNVIPAEWADQQIGYPSLMPLGAWIGDLEDRCAFIGNWIDNGKPIVFWMSGVFSPQAFLTGTLQNFARKYTKPVDLLSYGFSIVDMPLQEIVTPPQDGVYVHGLFLEGARWDASQGSLADSRPRELFSKLPVLWFLPEEDRVAPTSGIYLCPVYKELSRKGTLSTTGLSTNFVINVELPSPNEPADKWIKAGVALFCALRYQVSQDA